MILALLRRPGSLRAARFFCGVAWCAAGAAGAAQPEAASGFAPKPVAAGARFMAVTANPHATAAAVEILELGGSATDAAIAAQLVLNLVEPQSSGIGGGGFLLHWDQQRRERSAYDGRETAPAAARAERFLDDRGQPLPFREVVATGRSVGVPGLLAMLEMAHRDHGRLRWERLFRPAIRLASNGFPVSPRLHTLLAGDPHLRRNPAARSLYYDANGFPREIGETLRNPDFEATLRRLAGADSSVFYRGDLARAMVDATVSAGGDLTESDLAAYRPRVRAALCRPYRHWRICGMPPPSSGGATVLQLLGILERTDFSKHPPNSADAIHTFSEAGRLAFADRARYLGDPDFAPVPIQAMLDARYLERRAGLIRNDASLGEAAPGTLAPGDFRAGIDAVELPSTTHLSVVDAQGNAVALTSSIEDAFGSRIMAGGFLLNNQLTDFSFAAARDGNWLPNRVQPGKRPLSSMAPTLVFDRRGRLHAVLGSPGGSRIVNYVARTLVGLLDWQLAPATVLAMPHAGSRNGPTEIERRDGDERQRALKAELERRGHRVTTGDMTSGLNLIVRGDTGWTGAADPRREGLAEGR